MQSLNVPLRTHPYDLLFDRFLGERVDVLPVRTHVQNRRCLIVSDSIVAPLYAKATEQLLGEAGADRVDTVTFPAGEQSKTLDTMAKLYAAAVDHGLDRSSVVVALGGGVVGDSAGFLAATYMRGIDYLQVPTSLLAQVDSAIGGKTAVDLPQGKNLVGAFYQPCLVLIDVQSLTTLPPRQLRCGLAEVVKYGVILDAEFFRDLEESVPALLDTDLAVYQRVVRRCCELKAIVVLADERETAGRRVILNYGHTFGHALEKLADFEGLTHGEAVAIGMGMAADLAILLDDTPERRDLVARQDALLEHLGLPRRARGVAPQQVLEGMRTDKKYKGGRSRLILPVRLGHVELVEGVEETLIAQAIEGRCDQ